MKHALSATAVSFLATIALTHSDSMVVVLNFLVAGVVPGTSYVMPFWVMMVVYCLVITIITTLYIESLISHARSNREAHARQRRLPRRRYSHI